jgi:predicted transcriptional regulator YdeE
MRFFMDYESDFTVEYTALIGLEVANLDKILDVLVGKTIGGGNYEKRIIKGDPVKSIPAVWFEIWEDDSNLNRRYTSDFELYGSKSQRGEASEVKIYLSIAE